MTKPGSEDFDDFEFIETPAAPIPIAPAEDYGVRTTTASASTLVYSITCLTDVCVF